MAPTHEPTTRIAETPASESRSAKTKMGQKMVLVHHQSSNIHVYVDDDLNTMDEELGIVVGQQSIAVDDYVPLRTVRPESTQNGQEKLPGVRIKHGAKETSSGLTKPYKSKRGRPSGSKSAKSRMEQKPALFDRSSYNKGDNDDSFEPPTPMRKRGRQARSKSTKRKMEQEPFLIHSSGSSSEGKNMDQDFQPEVSDDDDCQKKYASVKGTAMDRAAELKKRLSAEGPSFAKRMTHSHVVKGFWLGLPASFCRAHLPEYDVDIVLEDEEGRICDTNYIGYKMGLSGRWQGFSKRHDLKVDDVLVFQLVRPKYFKVYILRENKFTANDGALGLLSLGTSMENNTKQKEVDESSNEDTKSKEEEPEVVTRVSRKRSSNNRGSLGSEEAARCGTRSPGPETGDFVAEKRLVNFKIILSDGSVVGHEVLPDHLSKTYQDLCQARNASLHRNLKHISPGIATQLIVDTAKIADGIRASSPASIEDLASWKKTLEVFEHMGMDVAFMCKRVDDLLGLLSAPSSTSVEPHGYRYEELKLRREGAVKQLRYLESNVSIVKDDLKKMDAEMEQMVETSVEKQKDQAVRKLAAAPW